MKRSYFIVIAVLSTIYIIHEVRRKHFSIKESFWWMIASIVMIFLSIFPYTIDKLAKLFGVVYPPSLFFVICIVFLVLMIFRNSKRISEQQMKIIELEQNLAILKEKNNDNSRERNRPVIRPFLSVGIDFVSMGRISARRVKI